MSFDDMGRFADPAFLILTSLADGPQHGYAMMEDIADFAGVKMGPGTLYGALARLEKLTWIEPLPMEERKRPYRLTPTGREVLQQRLDSLQAVTTLGRTRLGGAT
jgi:DNA-binding PadR family transcriptional regulator